MFFVFLLATITAIIIQMKFCFSFMEANVFALIGEGNKILLEFRKILFSRHFYLLYNYAHKVNLSKQLFS